MPKRLPCPTRLADAFPLPGDLGRLAADFAGHEEHACTFKSYTVIAQERCEVCGHGPQLWLIPPQAGDEFLLQVHYKGKFHHHNPHLAEMEPVGDQEMAGLMRVLRMTVPNYYRFW